MDFLPMWFGADQITIGENMNTEKTTTWAADGGERVRFASRVMGITRWSVRVGAGGPDVSHMHDRQGCLV